MQSTAHHPPRFVGPLLLAGLAVAPLLTACGGSSGGSRAEIQAAGGVRAREIPKVRVITIERREMTQVLETMTKLESEREIELFPRATGNVEELLVEEGDRVRTGEVLARLDDRDQVLAVGDASVALREANNNAELSKLAVDEAKARMESAELSAKQAVRDYERNLKLFEGREATSPLSKSALEASELDRERAQHDHRLAILSWQKSQLDEKASATAVERAKVALDRAELALSHCELTAPFDGVIAERRIRVGDSAGTAMAAFVLTDPENLRTVFRRPQEELPMFQGTANGKGTMALDVTATAEAVPGEQFRGEVVRVSPTIDKDSGQFRVTARLRPEDEGSGTSRLLPGMLVRLDIVTDRHPDALVVPKRALRREGERRYLFVVDPPEDGTDDDGDVAASTPDETAEPARDTDGEPADADEEGLEEPTLTARDESVRTIRRVDIEEGYGDDDFIEVTALEGEQLTEGTLVVLVGSRDLEDGALVDIGGGDENPSDEATPSTSATDAVAEADAGEDAGSAGDER